MTNWKSASHYFQQFPQGEIGNLFEKAEYPWSPLLSLNTAIGHFFEEKEAYGELVASRTQLLQPNGSLKEGSYFIRETQLLEENFIDPEFSIFIGKGTLVETGATIKNHTVIGENCEVRQGAYLRGNLYIGNHCVLGHTTEIKNSIFIEHVEAGHFAYIGDTIVGSYVNLGAGTKISNLQFRSFQEKQSERFPEIPFQVEAEAIRTGLSKFGAIVGDGCELGCNSVLSPFVLLQPECWIFPCLGVSKGVYPKGSILKSFQDCKESRL